MTKQQLDGLMESLKARYISYWATPSVKQSYLKKVQKQLERLSRLPDQGYFTFLHHAIPIERSKSLFRRLEYVVEWKARPQIYQRLYCIRFVAPLGCMSFAACSHGYKLRLAKSRIPAAPYHVTRRGVVRGTDL